MKDLRLEKLKEAEPHIDEFFNWITSHSQEIQTVLVMSNLYHELAGLEEQVQELQQSQKIALQTMPTYSVPTLEIIAGLMKKIQPPKNKRMEYLVSSQ